MVVEVTPPSPSTPESVLQYLQVLAGFKEAKTQRSHGLTSVILKLSNVHFEWHIIFVYVYGGISVHKLEVSSIPNSSNFCPL